MENTIQELTNSFQSIQETPISIQNVKKTVSYKNINYKKYSILGGILFILSLLLVIFFLDTKYYKKDDKIQYQYILLDTICIMIFLVFFYFATNWVNKLLYKI